MNDVVTVVFDVESEAYQAFTELRAHLVDSSFVVSEAALLKSDGKYVQVFETVDSGATTNDDTAGGMLVGSIAGIIGGPLGMLFGASVGALAGGAVDAFDAGEDISLIEQVANKLYDKQIAIIALVKEEAEGVFDALFSKYGCTIIRQDAAVVADEVEQAREVEAELERQAKAQMRAEKKAERKAKVDEQKARIEAHFEELKAKGEAHRTIFEEGVDEFEAKAHEGHDKVFGL